MTAPTPHIEAKPGEIADAVLLPGDPKRAAAIAEKFLDGAQCHNQVRNMLGFTGTYRGRRVSVQGTGMGMPSIAIYATELFRFYGVRTAIRVGSCGALQDEVRLRDLVIATAAHTDSAMIERRFKGITYAPTADAHRARALCISAVSDHIGRGEKIGSAERETGFLAMAELALDVVVDTTPA